MILIEQIYIKQLKLMSVIEKKQLSIQHLMYCCANRKLKELKRYIQGIIDKKADVEDMVSKFLQQSLVNKQNVTSTTMLSALILYKLLLISAQIDYYENEDIFPESIHLAVAAICQYKGSSKFQNRGLKYFIEKYNFPDDELNQKAGNTLVVLSLELIQNMATWYPYDFFQNGNKISRFKRYYDKLIKKGVIFPAKGEYFVMKNTDETQFKQNYQKMKKKLETDPGIDTPGEKNEQMLNIKFSMLQSKYDQIPQKSKLKIDKSQNEVSQEINIDSKKKLTMKNQNQLSTVKVQNNYMGKQNINKAINDKNQEIPLNKKILAKHEQMAKQTFLKREQPIKILQNKNKQTRFDEKYNNHNKQIEKPIAQKTTKAIDDSPYVSSFVAITDQKTSKKTYEEPNEIIMEKKLFFKPVESNSLKKFAKVEKPRNYSNGKVNIQDSKKSIPKIEPRKTKIQQQNIIKLKLGETMQSQFGKTKKSMSNYFNLKKDNQNPGKEFESSSNLLYLIEKHSQKQYFIKYIAEYFSSITHEISNFKKASLLTSKLSNQSETFYQNNEIQAKIRKAGRGNFTLTIYNKMNKPMKIKVIGQPKLNSDRLKILNQALSQNEYYYVQKQCFVDINFWFQTANLSFKYLNFFVQINNKKVQFLLPITLIDQCTIESLIDVDRIQNYDQSLIRLYTSEFFSLQNFPMFMAKQLQHSRKKFNNIVAQCSMMISLKQICIIDLVLRQVDHNRNKYQLTAIFNLQNNENEQFAKVLMQLIVFLISSDR